MNHKNVFNVTSSHIYGCYYDKTIAFNPPSISLYDIVIEDNFSSRVSRTTPDLQWTTSWWEGKAELSQIVERGDRTLGTYELLNPLMIQTQLYNCLSPKSGCRRRLLLPKYTVQCGLSCRLMTVWNWSPATGSWEPCLLYLTLFFKNLYKSLSNTNENKNPVVNELWAGAYHTQPYHRDWKALCSSTTVQVLLYS